MKRPVLIVALLAFGLLTLLVVGAAWMFVRTSVSSASVQATAPVLAEPAPVEAKPASLPGEVAAVPEPAVQAEDPAADQRRDASQRSFDPELARSVVGQVALPAKLPADEQLTVLAYASNVDPLARLRRSGGRVAPELTLAGVDPDHTSAIDEPVAHAEVDAAGGFELALPSDLESVWLVLDARYLRQLQGQKILVADPVKDLRLETELGAWISGRLLPPAGLDLGSDELEELEVTWAPGELSDFTQMGRGGSVELEPRKSPLDPERAFEIRGVQIATTGDLRVVPESLAAHKSARLEPRAGEHLVVDLPLTRGGTLQGRVVDESGAPVGGAELTVEIDPVMMGMGGFEVRAGESAEDGSFTLAAVRAGKLTVRVQAEGYIDHRSELELAVGETRGDLMLEISLGNAIAGSVRWPDGRPAEGAKVNATFDLANMAGMGAFNAMRGPRGDDTADAQGAFRITGLGKGPFTVTAKAKQDAEDDSGESWAVRLDGVKPETLDLALVLAPPIGLAGRVVDENGEPVTSFRVSAQEKTGGMIPGLGGQTVNRGFGDEDGRFRLEGLSERTWTLIASGQGTDSGFGRGEPLEVKLPAPSPDFEVTLVLPHSATVHGSVLSPEGQPVGGATVTLQLELAGLASLGGSGATPPSTTSEDDGTFVLAGLTPGALSLVASASDYAKSAGVPVDLKPAEQVHDVVVQLRRGGRILGEIFAKDGSPKADATILTQSPADLANQRWATSDSDGKFLFEHVPPGSWQVMTMPGQNSLESMDGDNFAEFFSEMKFQMAEVIEGEDVHVVLGGQPADPVKVSGRVMVDQQPQVGALVSFIADGDDGTPAMKFTTTGKGGAYSLDLDKPGGYLVQVQKMQGGAGQQQSVQLHYDLPEESEQVLDLNLPVGSIGGLVRGPDGKPLAGARVSLAIEGGVSNLTFGGGQYAEIATDENGRYQLVWLREGTYSIGAGGPLMGGMFGGGDDAPARRIQAGIRLRDGQHLSDIDFRLEAPGRLVGTVKDPAGKPIEGAAVFVRDENGQLLERISLAASDAAGRFTYSGIGAGKYLVHARSSTQVSSEAQVRVREGEDAEAHLVLDPGTILLVVLADGDGNPVDCSVTVTDDDGRQVNGTWSLADLMGMFSGGSFSSKEQRVGPVPAGRYTIHASTSDGLSATKRVSVSGQEERKVNLRLKD